LNQQQQQFVAIGSSRFFWAQECIEVQQLKTVWVGKASFFLFPSFSFLILIFFDFAVVYYVLVWLLVVQLKTARG
jgi:hypothetical protein